MLSQALFACLATIASPPQSPAPLRIVSERYELRYDGSQDDAEETSRILECAHAELAKFFGWRPKERMRFCVFRDEKTRVEGAWAEGVTVPSYNRQALFSEKTRTAYVARLDTAQSSRSALLYAACLQFHSLGKSKNLDVGGTWQAWGIAMDFGRSTWNGVKLTAFATPLVDPFDMPQRALAELGDGRPILTRAAMEAEVDPNLAWGLVAMCLHGGDNVYRDKFRRYALGDTGTKLNTVDFVRTLGRNEKVVADLRKYLEKTQIPFESIGDWEDRGEAELMCHGQTSDRAFALLPEGRTSLSATLTPPTQVGGRFGFVAGWGSEDNCSTIEFEPPDVLVRITRIGDPSTTTRLPIGDKRWYRIALERTVDRHVLTVDGTRFEDLQLPSGRMGFFATGTEVSFREVAWR